jgi:hypothetical protein
MSKIRRLSLLLSSLALLPFAGCGGSSPTPPAPPELQAEFEKQQIYFADHPPEITGTPTRVGSLSGLSCRDALIGVHATREAALQDLQKKLEALEKKPKEQSASAVIDVVCYDTSPLVAYESKPLTYKGCWPGVFCSGEAIR